MNAQAQQENSFVETQVHTREQRKNITPLTYTGSATTEAHRTNGESHLCTPSAATRRIG
ncbi:MAG: hypothetical protein GY942_09245 [Aestuariibacter sp.]|nr:hypothetical protein [Aestuariibacter sp.]